MANGNGGVLAPPEDPTILVLPVSALPPDLTATEGFVASQPKGFVPGATFSGGVGASPSPFAWPGAPPIQGDNLLNGFFQSGVNAPITIALQGAGGVRIHIYSVLCRTVPGGASTIQIQDGPTILYPPNLIPAITPALTNIVWPVALTIRENNSAFLLFTAAGVGNAVAVFVQADRF